MRLKFFSISVLSLCLFLFCALPILPPKASEASEPSVRSVDFYPGGAKFLFQIDTIKAGANVELSIPGAFDPGSVRFLNREDIAFVRIESVSSEEWAPPAIQPLKAKIDEQDHALKLLKSRQTALNQTITRINSPLPKDLGGRDIILFIEDSRSMLMRLGEELVGLDLEIEKAEKDLNLLRAEYEGKMPDNAGTLLQINVVSAANRPLMFEAFTYSAGWNVLYDMNLDSATGRIDSKMRAQAWQRTGVDAAGEFTFHTRQPSFAVTPPDVRPLTVKLTNQEYAEMLNSMKGSFGVVGDVSAESAPAPRQRKRPDVISTLADVSVKGKGDMKGDGSPEDVELGQFEMQSVPVLVSVPEQNRLAWIIASMDAVPESLLPGTATLSVDGEMTGKLRLPDFGEEQMRLPFGMASRLTSKKSPLVSKTGSSWLGLGKGTLADGYTLEITNMMDTERKITVKDRIPVPVDDKITLEVTRIDPAPAERDKDNRLTWEINAAPGATVKITVEYTLRYPDDGTLEYR